MSALRLAGGIVGFALAAGAACWLGRVELRNPWVGVVVIAALSGWIGACLGSGSPLPPFLHRALMGLGSVAGGIGGVFLGIHLVHGTPARGEFGARVVACSAALGLAGFLVPFFLVGQFVPVECGRCGRAAYLRAEGRFFGTLGTYQYRCRSCGHAERVTRGPS